MKISFFAIILLALGCFLLYSDSCYAQCEPVTTTNENVPTSSTENMALTYNPMVNLISFLMLTSPEDPLVKAVLKMSLQDLLSAAAGRIPEDLVKAWGESMEQMQSRAQQRGYRPADPPPPIENDYGA